MTVCNFIIVVSSFSSNFRKIVDDFTSFIAVLGNFRKRASNLEIVVGNFTINKRNIKNSQHL
jgi:hypothetical protein